MDSNATGRGPAQSNVCSINRFHPILPQHTKRKTVKQAYISRASLRPRHLLAPSPCGVQALCCFYRERLADPRIIVARPKKRPTCFRSLKDGSALLLPGPAGKGPSPTPASCGGCPVGEIGEALCPPAVRARPSALVSSVRRRMCLTKKNPHPARWAQQCMLLFVAIRGR